MSGIYIHIPFCKQACHYCDFHFSTQLKKKAELLNCLIREMEWRKKELGGEPIATIYFGGGTPSILEIEELNTLIQAVYEKYSVLDDVEITLEANPDDLTTEKITALSKSRINRLSIGVQSFHDADLRLMNRAHNAVEAKSCIEHAVKHFENVSIDLIYGIPGLSDEQWQVNIDAALAYGVPHISSYALTVEPRTALKRFIEKGVVSDVDDEQAERQFLQLAHCLENEGFVNYELSNFGKPGFFSKNNTAYWQGKTYLGIGPSAHSYDGEKRGWNVRNNAKYIQNISSGKLAMETEQLSTTDRYNEYVMTGLRTIWGVSLKKVHGEFGESYGNYLKEQAKKYVDEHLLFWDDEVLRATKKGKFLVDGIASHLFMVNLS